MEGTLIEDKRAHEKKARSPITLRFSDNFNVVRPEQPKKASRPIDITLFGITIDSN